MTKEELRVFIDKNTPFGVKAIKPSNNVFVDPFSSKNARKVVIESLTNKIYDNYFDKSYSGTNLVLRFWHSIVKYFDF